MPNFDGTIDNRWRPDLESSQRRVREEEQAEVVHSRELSFVPARRESFEAYDAQTAALIRRVVERGISVVYISHNMPEVLEVADRIEVLRLGVRVATFQAHDATLEQLVAAMTGALTQEDVA